MSNRPDQIQLPAPLGLAAMEAAAAYARQSLSAATLRAYKADWAHFTAWCREAGMPALPTTPQAVAAYLATMAETHARATIRRRLAAIGQAQQLAGHEWMPSHPAIRNTLRGMFRQHGRPQKKAAALGRPEIKQLIAGCDDSLAGVRDRALILLGFAGALRRSELAAIEREHVTITGEGVRLLIPRAKGDQQGEGELVGIPRGRVTDTCPVRALAAWLERSNCKGPVFRKVGRGERLWATALNPHGVWQILTRRAAEAGLSVEGLETLSPHGLRAGFVTDAYKAGARDEQIMTHTRHKDLKTMHGYIRRAKLMEDSPVNLLGL